MTTPFLSQVAPRPDTFPVRPTGRKVTVWGPIGQSFGLRGATYLVSVLRSLGYKATLKLIPGQTYFQRVSDSRERAQAGPSGWTADYASASDFFGPLLTCASFKPATKTDNANLAEFCDPAVDGGVARAQALQTSDPQAASELWSEIDRKVIDDAPWVVLPSTQTAEFVSSRVGNYTYDLFVGGALLDQLWVR